MFCPSTALLPSRWSFAKLYKIRPDLVPHVADAGITCCDSCVVWWFWLFSSQLVFELLMFANHVITVATIYIFFGKPLLEEQFHPNRCVNTWKNIIASAKRNPDPPWGCIVANQVVLWPKVARIHFLSIDSLTMLLVYVLFQQLHWSPALKSFDLPRSALKLPSL